MLDAYGKGKIDFSFEIIQTKRTVITYDSLNPAGQSCFLRTFFERPDHILLDIHTYNFAVRTDHLRKGQTEKTHRTADISNRHCLVYIWFEKLVRIFPNQFSNRRW